MRIYPFWYLRFLTPAAAIPVTAALVVFATHEFVLSGSAVTFTSGFALISAVALLALGGRALGGGLELTDEHVIVRNPFSTTAVPWERALRVEAWILVWSDAKARERATPLVWFSEPLVAPRSLKRYNARALAALSSRIQNRLGQARSSE